MAPHDVLRILGFEIVDDAGNARPSVGFAALRLHVGQHFAQSVLDNALLRERRHRGRRDQSAQRCVPPLARQRAGDPGGERGVEF